MAKKVVMAYSGGLDTTVILSWLQENYDCEVIAVCVDVGQGKETEGLEERALSFGASKFFLEDAREEFVTDYITPMLKSRSIYEHKYLLGTSIARPLIAKKLVDIALAEGADAICHGCTGKGNDQVRFELTINALAPQLEVIAPWRIWDISSREDAIDYLTERNLPVLMKKEDSYSRDGNLWHLSHEGLDLERPANAPQLDKLLKFSVSPEKAPNTATNVEIDFEQGVPCALNGKKMPLIDIITELNVVGGQNGIGIVDLVENRVVGMKSRGVYETPGGTILYWAHQELESLCLDRQTTTFKATISNKLAELIYSGEWFTPLREALSAFIDKTQQQMTGKVKLKLYKGNLTTMSLSSPYSLYDEDIASFETGDLYNHKDAEGFINLFTLPTKVRALMQQRKGMNPSGKKAA